MAAEQNKGIARQLIESAWNQHDLTTIDKLVGSNYTFHGPFHDQFPKGSQGLKAFLSTLLEAFPDLRLHLGEQEADGDLVKTPWTMRGTHQGQLLQIAATGKWIAVNGMTTDRIARGKVVESWFDWEPQDLLRQLGAAEAMRPGLG